MRQAITSRHVVTEQGARPACVVFEDGRVLGVESPGVPTGVIPVLDVGERWLLPGLVDSHVHINEPGRTEWEGFATATRAAAAGGYTCLVDMPLNSVPATIDVASLQHKRAAARGQCAVDVAFWGGAVQGNSGELKALADAGVAGFKSFLVHPGIEEFTMVGEAELRSAMPVIAETGLPLLVHAEHPAEILKANSGRSYTSYLRSRPDDAELRAIELMIRLCREYRCRVHIVHLASAAAIPMLRDARAEGLPITAETCPHYLYFAAEEIPDGATEFKCAPPIRAAANRELLWEGLREGVIDLIATDHSPCPPALKLQEEGDFSRAWGGVASLSVALSVVRTAARKRAFTVEDIVRWMSARTSALAGLAARKGRIAKGLDADFVVFDPDESFIVAAEHLHFRHPITPYLGRLLTGRVTMTFLRGACVFDHGKFLGSCPGGECTVSEWTTAS